MLLSYADLVGGAARAAYRLHQALIQNDLASQVRVRLKESDDWTVNGPNGRLNKTISRLRPELGGLLMRVSKAHSGNLRTGNWLPSGMAKQINASDVDIVNMHWVAGETLSIEDIGRIRKPIVWTLHDMWPFCGTEHYASDDVSARWRTGYNIINRPVGDSGLDVDRLVWLRKLRAWKQPMHIIAPSRWLGDCARESTLFRHWPISVIPNVLDTEIYQPLDRNFCRQAIGLPEGQQIILFGALGAGHDSRKGYDLLVRALQGLAFRVDTQNLLCVIFGQNSPKNPPVLPFSIRWMGAVHDDTTLALLYNAADVMVVPSRQENLPQTATESQACGCPVVAFDCTGLLDVVIHQETGYLARAYDTDDMAEGLRWVLEDASRRQLLGHAARERALKLWAPDVVVPQYLRIYEDAMSMQGTDR